MYWRWWMVWYLSGIWLHYGMFYNYTYIRLWKKVIQILNYMNLYRMSLHNNKCFWVSKVWVNNKSSLLYKLFPARNDWNGGTLYEDHLYSGYTELSVVIQFWLVSFCYQFHCRYLLSRLPIVWNDIVPISFKFIYHLKKYNNINLLCALLV